MKITLTYRIRIELQISTRRRRPHRRRPSQKRPYRWLPAIAVVVALVAWGAHVTVLVG